MTVSNPVEPPLDRIRAHLALVATRDLYDPEHIEQVAQLSVKIAGRLGLSPAELADVEQVARLRDVGKAMVPIAVLRKEGPLDEAEWALLRRYPEHGGLLVSTTPGWERLAPAVRACNERWDGAGYPDGLAGDAIPWSSRIAYVAQAYRAMRTDRPYRAVVGRAEAIVEVARGAGSQFCPRTVGALVEVLLDESEPGAPGEQAQAARAVPRPPVAFAPPGDAAGPVRASVAHASPPRRRKRWVAALGGLAGAVVGLALVLPLPDAGRKCPPPGEGRGMCLVQDVFVPAATVVAICAVVGALLLAFALLRLPVAAADRRRRRALPPAAAPAFARDAGLSAASWGIVYDDENTALRAVGRRRWRRDTRG